MNHPSNLENEIKKWQELKQLFEIAKTTPSLKKWGEEGLWEVICACSRLGISLERGLNGLYKVEKREARREEGYYPARSSWNKEKDNDKEKPFGLEMSVHLMSSLIRNKGHSISKDPKSDNTRCILHGERADNQSRWTATFSMQEAKQAGLTGKKGDMWIKYPQRMMYARALAILARELFSDVIEGMYVEGELSNDTFPTEKEEMKIESAPSFEELPARTDILPPPPPSNYEHIMHKVSDNVWQILEDFPDIRDNLKKALEHNKIDLGSIPFSVLSRVSVKTSIPVEKFLAVEEEEEETEPNEGGEENEL